MLFPFAPIYFPVMIWFRATLKKEHTNSKFKNTRRKKKHDKLIAAVCDRIMFGDLMSGSRKPTDMMNKRVSLKKQESVFEMIAEKVKQKENV